MVKTGFAAPETACFIDYCGAESALACVLRQFVANGESWHYTENSLKSNNSVPLSCECVWYSNNAQPAKLELWEDLPALIDIAFFVIYNF